MIKIKEILGIFILSTILLAAGCTEKEKEPEYWHPTESLLDPNPYQHVEPALPVAEKELHPLYPGMDQDIKFEKVDRQTLRAYLSNDPEKKEFIITSPNGIVILDARQRQSNSALIASAMEKWSFSLQNNGRCELTIIVKDIGDIPNISVTTPTGKKKFARDFHIARENDVATLMADKEGFNDIDVSIIDTKTYKEHSQMSAFPWGEKTLKITNDITNEELLKIVISGSY